MTRLYLKYFKIESTRRIRITSKIHPLEINCKNNMLNITILDINCISDIQILINYKYFSSLLKNISLTCFQKISQRIDLSLRMLVLMLRRSNKIKYPVSKKQNNLRPHSPTIYRPPNPPPKNGPRSQSSLPLSQKMGLASSLPSNHHQDG